ncbi:MAG: hypothetical protein V4516_12875 [Pseudomonadota bacterium]
MVDIARQPWCPGGAYQGAAAEFVDPAHPAHAAALGVKERALARLTDLASREGHADPAAVAEGVYLLLEGVWATTRMFGAKAPLSHAKDAIRKRAPRTRARRDLDAAPRRVQSARQSKAHKNRAAPWPRPPRFRVSNS